MSPGRSWLGEVWTRLRLVLGFGATATVMLLACTSGVGATGTVMLLACSSDVGAEYPLLAVASESLAGGGPEVRR